jgi:hypothetical protein
MPRATSRRGNRANRQQQEDGSASGVADKHDARFREATNPGTRAQGE